MRKVPGFGHIEIPSGKIKTEEGLAKAASYECSMVD